MIEPLTELLLSLALVVAGAGALIGAARLLAGEPQCPLCWARAREERIAREQATQRDTLPIPIVTDMSQIEWDEAARRVNCNVQRTHWS